MKKILSLSLVIMMMVLMLSGCLIDMPVKTLFDFSSPEALCESYYQHLFDHSEESLEIFFGSKTAAEQTAVEMEYTKEAYNITKTEVSEVLPAKISDGVALVGIIYSWTMKDGENEFEMPMYQFLLCSENDEGQWVYHNVDAKPLSEKQIAELQAELTAHSESEKVQEIAKQAQTLQEEKSVFFAQAEAKYNELLGVNTPDGPVEALPEEEVAPETEAPAAEAPAAE